MRLWWPSSDLWHQRLAHVNDKVLQKLVSCDVAGVDLKKVEARSFCEGCVQVKATKHKLGEIRSNRRLEKVHSDVCGPMQIASSSGKKYMVTFVDDFSRSCATYFMAHKSDTYEIWYSPKPDLSNLRVFGCVAYALVPAAKRRKFDDRTVKMRFLGYHKGHRGYKLMEQRRTRVFYRTDVMFDEYNFRLT